jgi:hypothetical protein
MIQQNNEQASRSGSCFVVKVLLTLLRVDCGLCYGIEEEVVPSKAGAASSIVS